MLKVKEYAVRIGVSPATVYRWIHAGHVPALRHGKPIEPGAAQAPGGAIRIPEPERPLNEVA